MRLLVEGHLHATTVLAHDFAAQWTGLTSALGALMPPLRQAGPYSLTTRPKTPKRQLLTLGGLRANVLMPVDQSAMNRAIDTSLVAAGWSRQPYVLVDRQGQPIDTRLRGDFESDGVLVEVEFGNIASLYRDLFKFHIAGTSGAAQVGIIVVATAALARFFDQGVATYEQALTLLPYMRAGLQLPTTIIGLDVEDWSAVRDRYEQMRAIVENSGETCHPFNVVMAAPMPEAIDDDGAPA
jgi:hypothetical protein